MGELVPLRPGQPAGHERPPLDVLLVEDNMGDALIVRELLAQELGHDGAVVRHETTLAGALLELEKRPPSCLLLDLDLPDAGGLEAVERTLALDPDVPVVVLTGRGDRVLAATAVHLGAQDFVVKGRLDGDVLVRAMTHAAERHRMRRALAVSERRVRAMFESVPVAQCAITLDGHIVEVNRAAAVMLGTNVDALVGMHVDDLLIDADVPWHPRVQALVDSGGTWTATMEHQMRLGEGPTVSVRATTSVVFDGSGRPSHLVALIEDITLQRRTEAELRVAEAEYRRIYETTHDGVWRVDGTSRTVEVNARMAEMLGRTREEMLGRPVADFLADDDRDGFDERFALRRSGIVGNARMRFRHRDGSTVMARGTGRGVFDEHGTFQGVVAIITDVTEQARAEEALRTSEAKLRAIVGNLSELVSVHDADGKLTWLTPSAAWLLGDDYERHIGSVLIDLVHPEDRAHVRRAFASLVSQDGWTTSFTCRVVNAEGDWRELEVVAVSLLDDPAVGGIVLTSRDATERLAAERELARRAMHDALTDLPSRVLFVDRLRQALGRSRREHSSVAVMFVDVDRFKSINDSLGHDVGDEVLRALATLLESAVRPGDTVARFGGDEFVVCCENIENEAMATAIAARFMRRLQTPFSIAGRSFFVTISVGIAMSAPEGFVDLDKLLRTADAAMYRAKASGGGTYQLATGDVDEQIVKRFELEERLRHAIERGELSVSYQPEVRMDDGVVVGMEALARWTLPGRGPVPPSEFIPLAEETGLIVEIGQWVLETACRDVARWQSEQSPGEAPYFVSVNLSGRQLLRPGIADEIAALVAGTALDPSSLWFEITESVLMADVDAAGETLARLRELGFHLAIDDFGTGWSSLTYLRRFPVELLKVDRSFVTGIGRNQEDSTIVAAVISLARSLGLHSIAEGVEEEDQRVALASLGCDLGQGYLWSAAMAADEMGPWLRRQAARPNDGTARPGM